LWFRRIRRLLELDRTRWPLLAEAVLLLLASRTRIFIAARRQRKPDFGRGSVSVPEAPRTPEQNHAIQTVAWAVAAASRRLPWGATCLMRAMAAKAMLRRRGIESTLHLGIRMDPEKGALAHAWLSVGSLVVTGEAERSRFTSVAYFT
jgi:hypothetical protein